MFFNELELLELRLMTLNRIVDKFVLVELGMTHSGKEKELYFENNKSLFKEYLHKIVHIKRQSIPFENSWQVENANRNLLQEGFQDASKDDYIMISDADEIPNPDTVIEGISKGYNSFGMLQDLFCYYVNCQENRQWGGTVVTKKEFMRTPQDSRNDRCTQAVMIENGGWHYTACGGMERIKYKFESFAETTYNIPLFVSDENILRSLETGADLVHRTDDRSQKRFLTLEQITHKEVKQWIIKYPNFYKNGN